MGHVRRVFHLLFVGAVVLSVSGTGWAAETAGAKALEARLNAPCCYGGTLDIHESDLARSLREEIESRLARGESSDAIQADFVARYGDRVLAARSDSPIRAIGIGIVLAAISAAAGLALLLRRWTRRGRDEDLGDPSTSREPRDALDERIDAELADLDA